MRGSSRCLKFCVLRWHHRRLIKKTELKKCLELPQNSNSDLASLSQAPRMPSQCENLQAPKESFIFDV